MLLHNCVRDAAIGDRIIMYATDPSAQKDVEKFCNFLGHRLLRAEQLEDEWIFELLKGGESGA